MKKILIAVIGLSAASLHCLSAQVLITDASNFTYTQNFDGLAISGSNNTWTNNTTISSWYSNRTSYSANNGTSTAVALSSYGSTGSLDRALGALSTGSGGPNFALVVLNSSGSAIPLQNITISYTGEQWRATANLYTLSFDYQISSSPITDSTTGTYTSLSALSFTAPNTGSNVAVDGNAVSNQASISSSLGSSGSLGNGEFLSLRWSRTAEASSPGLAIDNFQLQVVPEPTTWALIGLGTAFVLWRIRRKRSEA